MSIGVADSADMTQKPTNHIRSKKATMAIQYLRSPSSLCYIGPYILNLCTHMRMLRLLASNFV